MNRFSVVWWQFAKSRLAELWLDAADKAVVTRAADEIDRQLAADPMSCAENRHEELCRLTVDPLTVQFTVEELDRRVTVWSVRALICSPPTSD
jgi:hypothetical protein